MRHKSIHPKSAVCYWPSVVLALGPWLCGGLPTTERQAAAGTTQVALFTGFLAGPNAGMDILNEELAAAGIPNYNGMVFDWDAKRDAVNWINMGTDDRSTLVLIGHSFGGNSTLQVANTFLKPAGIDVDLTIQIDSVENFDRGWNDMLPTNVDVGINYYQFSTGGIFEPQGETFVQGATNINAEEFFNDTSITHTSLDNDPRLHAQIELDILDNINFVSGDFDWDNDVDGSDFLAWQQDPSSGLLTDWETAYPLAASAALATTVPEPSTVLMSMATLVLLVGRRP